MWVESMDNQHQWESGQSNRCLNCNELCHEAGLFCDACQTQLYSSEQSSPNISERNDVAKIITTPHPVVAAPQQLQHAQHAQQTYEHIQCEENAASLPPLANEPAPTRNNPHTPPPSVHGAYVDIVDSAIHRLNDAARRIAAVQQQSERRQPRASRLSPLRDISADIQRQSTPLPKAVRNAADADAKTPQVKADSMPDLWPWIPDADEIDNSNPWENYTDPLLSRHFPDSTESARIEAEDERRARADGFIITPFLRASTRYSRLRLVLVALAILAVLALTIDTALVSVAILHPHHTSQVPVSGPPTLTITSDISQSNQAIFGQRVFFHLTHFNPSTTVLITHDVAVPVVLTTGIASVKVGTDGNALASTIITVDDWGPGFHTVDAEDIQSHYTASATLQIIHAGPTKPSHLVIKDTSLDLGTGYQGSNSIQPFTLSNDANASGAITWAASSDKPWLLLTPSQGTFSDTQTISVGVERGMLTSGDYVGNIVFSSNVGAPIKVQVHMSVVPLPANSGPVLMIAPVVLSFTTQDGASNTTSSQVLVVSNPGHQSLSWSLTNNPVTGSGQGTTMGTPGVSTNWLSTSISSGTIPPGDTENILVSINSQNVLPGAYTSSLTFMSSSKNVLNGSQSVSVSLTVQQPCSLNLSTGGMMFTAISNSSNTGSQSLNVSASASCSGAVNWNASTSTSWLTITPNSGSTKTGNTSIITVGVNTANLTPNTYVGTIAVVSGSSGSSQGNTQSVSVNLTVQSPPPSGAPVLSAAPLTVSFSTIQGQPISSGQTVLITNSGQNVLQWNTSVSQLATSWLGVSPTGGKINPGQSATLTVLAVSTGLTPGTYNGQITLNGSDTSGNAASGSPQNVAVQMLVNSPCALIQPASSALSFTTIQGSGDPVAQSVQLSASGSCTWPLNWKASISHATRWLQLSSTSGSLNSGSASSALSISTSVAKLAPGTYTAQVSVSASDGSGVIAQGSPQVFSITLVVQPPCLASILPTNLAFNVAQGQVSATQNFSLSETGTCARPVTWSATGGTNSTSWLTVSPTSGSDTGNGSMISVSVNATSLTPGNYKASVTVAASNGATIGNNTQAIPITVTVTGFTISGTVNMCGESTCTNPVAVPLPASTVVLTNSSGTKVSTVVSDTNGNYTFTNVPLGTYTVSASGTSGTVNYSGSISVTVAANMPGSNITLLQSGA